MKDINLQAKCAGCLLHVAQLVLSHHEFWVVEEGNGFRLRQHFVQQPQSLRLHVSGEKIYSGGIAAGSIVARYQTGFDRIRAGRKYDRNGRSRGLGSQRRGFTAGRNDKADG